MDKNWNKSFAHIEDRTGADSRKRLEHKSSTSLLSIYFLVYTFATVQIPVHNATKGRGGGHRNLSNMWKSIFKIGVAQVHSITETEPKSPMVLVCEKKPYRIWFYPV